MRVFQLGQKDNMEINKGKARSAKNDLINIVDENEVLEKDQVEKQERRESEQDESPEVLFVFFGPGSQEADIDLEDSGKTDPEDGQDSR
jgi:hypothetical protein